MEIEFQLLEKDYIKFNIDHSKKSASLKKNIFSQRILGPIIFLLFPFIISIYSKIPILYWFTIFGILSVLWFVLYPKYFNWEMERRVKKVLREGNNENIYIKRKIVLSDEGILEKSSIGESYLNWDKVGKIEETNEYIYVYISSVSAHIIPKRVFKDKNEEEMFIRELSKHNVLV